MSIPQLKELLASAKCATSAHNKAARIERLIQHEFAQWLSSGDVSFDQFTDQESRILINLVHEHGLHEASRDKHAREALWKLVQSGVKECRNAVWPVDKLVVRR